MDVTKTGRCFVFLENAIPLHKESLAPPIRSRHLSTSLNLQVCPLFHQTTTVDTARQYSISTIAIRNPRRTNPLGQTPLFTYIIPRI